MSQNGSHQRLQPHKAPCPMQENPEILQRMLHEIIVLLQKFIFN